MACQRQILKLIRNICKLQTQKSFITLGPDVADPNAVVELSIPDDGPPVFVTERQNTDILIEAMMEFSDENSLPHPKGVAVIKLFFSILMVVQSKPSIFVDSQPVHFFLSERSRSLCLEAFR